ncbi:MAG: hypothetical protein A2Y33_08165 [Spirochaetes bacterium GWF1_51_8]|nr:MAG: hypothetical protein A2Y33_08165 [Spirochaetes bacterium GWF1_51_8]
MNELREGMVLNQDLVETLGLRQGRVLTAADINKIKDSNSVGSLSVVLSQALKNQLNKTDSFQQRMTAQTAVDNSVIRKPSAMQAVNMNDAEMRNALFDKNLDGKLKEVVEMKKSVIRGEGYHDRVDTHRNKNLEKFAPSIKSIQSHLKKDTMAVIDHYAQTNADFEGIREINPLESSELVKKSGFHERNAEFFLDAVLNKKSVFSSFVENIVVDFMSDMGYELARGLLTFIAQNDSQYSFISSHSLQVMMISIITAIELTRIINEKTHSLNSDDLSTLLSISKKSFTLDELVNLGIAALLHDIDFKKQIPSIRSDTVLNIQQQSIIDLHPSNGYHIAKGLNIDFEVQRAVFQHHERYDGTGFPSGLFPRFFTKYTPILMFAEYYTELITKNPFTDTMMTPREAIVRILSNERQKFDGDVVYAFLKAASLYPVGSWVLLSNQKIGLVRKVNSDKLDKPNITVFFDNSFNRIANEEVDLSKSEIQIVKPIAWDIVRSAVKGPLDFIYS